jgi:hypothetical protein
MKPTDLTILPLPDPPGGFIIHLPNSAHSHLFQSRLMAESFRAGWRCALGMPIDLPVKEYRPQR